MGADQDVDEDLDDDLDDVASLLSLRRSSSVTSPTTDWHFYPPACFLTRSDAQQQRQKRSVSLTRRNERDDVTPPLQVFKGQNKYKHANRSHNLNTIRGVKQIVQRYVSA